MKKQSAENGVSFEDNYKKAVTELLVLHLMSDRERYIGELPEEIRRISGGAVNIVFPYAAIYRMLERGQIEEIKKRVAPDGRRRQYYCITDKGQEYYHFLMDSYLRLSAGVGAILEYKVEERAGIA